MAPAAVVLGGTVLDIQVRAAGCGFAAQVLPRHASHPAVAEHTHTCCLRKRAQACPDAGYELRRGSSVLGRAQQLPGGVGRNIAEAAHHLLAGGAPDEAAGGGVLLISVVGQDTAGDALLASFRQLG
jgi:sugar/nucleoside kinase (ribokinase family)